MPDKSHEKLATGHAAPVIDTIRAAIAIENNLSLATRNTQDVRSPSAAILDALKDDPAGFPLGRR